MAQKRISAVFDRMLFLQSLLTDDGPAGECLERFELGQFDLLVSEAILEEIRFVLSRTDLRERFSSLTSERLETLLNVLAAKARHVSPEELP